MKKLIQNVLINMRNIIKYDKYIKNKNNENIAADIMRYTHSIEKGLSLENIRLGFGREKLKNIIILTNQLDMSKYSKEVISMTVSTINEYVKYHKKMDYKDEFISELEKFITKYKLYLMEENFGGVKRIKKEDMIFDISEIEKFFMTRHSVRDFSDEIIENDELKKAISLAQTAPSACNRQGYRIHIIDNKSDSILKNWLSGVGGFADAIDKILIITGKVSVYKSNENYQYIVSASIFAAYLSLTLHLYNMGACIIQRPVIWTKKWNQIRKKYNIPSDEQIVCILGVGKLKDEFNVPVSHRLSIDEISNFIK